MIWHPLLLAVLVADATALVLLIAGAATSARVVLSWSPGSAARGQLRLEARRESASILGRAAAWLFGLSTLLLLVAVTAVLPEVVPGAMCGTGVLQAAGAAGSRGLWLRGLAIAALAAWHVLDRLDSAAPRSPLAVASARAMLVGVPLAGLAVLATVDAVRSLGVHGPVDCCAVVYYEEVGALAAGTEALLPDAVWVALWTGLGAVVVVLSFLVWRSRAGSIPALAVLAVLWVPLAVVALLRVLAAYHFGVLHHHCPWCLFLPEHGLVGYPLFLALAVVMLEGPAGFIAARVGRKVPALGESASRRTRRAGIRVLVASGVFLLFAGLPPLVWRIRFGVWMS